MEESSIFQNYPAWMIALANGLNLSIYALGATIVASLGWALLALYLLFLLYLEAKVMLKSCTHCFYYGKRCFTGKGILSSWFFKRQDPSKFSSRELRWWSLLPDLLVPLIPLGIGVFLLIRRFDWTLLVLMAGLIILAFPGNGFIRGKIACCHCHQRELGCPAEQLFHKK